MSQGTKIAQAGGHYADFQREPAHIIPRITHTPSYFREEEECACRWGVNQINNMPKIGPGNLSASSRDIRYGQMIIERGRDIVTDL